MMTGFYPTVDSDVDFLDATVHLVGCDIDVMGQVLPYKHPTSGKTLLIYLGDRWNGHGENGGVGNASYVWLPIVPDPASPSTKFTMPGLASGKGDGSWQIAKY